MSTNKDSEKDINAGENTNHTSHITHNHEPKSSIDDHPYDIFLSSAQKTEAPVLNTNQTPYPPSYYSPQPLQQAAPCNLSHTDRFIRYESKCLLPE